MSELDDFASYANGATIEDEAVTAIVGVRRGETLGDLLDRVLAHDAPARWRSSTTCSRSPR